jgi:hypothetical protein
VRAGQLVDLRWSPADSIAELEILLSVDGGRHYSRCISPRLDPRKCGFVWRVPDLGSATLQMRIRFNRGGREIEGAPAAPLLVFAGGRDQAEPLALPPLGGAEPSRPSNGRGEAPASGSTTPFAQGEPSVHSKSPRETQCVRLAAIDPRVGPGTCHTALAAPQFVPMRT